VQFTLGLSGGLRMINALSFDLEYWYTAELVCRCVPDEKEDQVIEAVYPLLDLLDEYNTKATFFVLGKLAEKYPELIREISENGHEIGSHSYSHKTLHELGIKNFEYEIEKTNEILRSITGRYPLGFRAPTFSIDNTNKWALDILVKNGYRYDSSIFPVKTNLYGVPGAPVVSYNPSRNDITVHDPDGPIIEYPLSVIKFGINIPISGGFYLRLFPISFLKYAINRVNMERSVVIYMHPWEMYSHTRKVQLPLVSHFITYYGVNSAFNKLDYLLANFKFSPIKEVLGL
jgi:polysaccharide deacetylase family protein (PEP-CTERM system associated)